MNKASLDIYEGACAHAFGRRLVQNNLRSIIVETMVSKSLGPTWLWCSGNWSAFDFLGPNGVRLEVKQSAVDQSWDNLKPSKEVYDIRPRKARYEKGLKLIRSPSPIRNNDLYIFAHHGVWGELADHRDPAQWRFRVVPTYDLPLKAKSIRSFKVAPVSFKQLKREVARQAAVCLDKPPIKPILFEQISFLDDSGQVPL